jgi:hypothetical protein
MVPGEVEKRAGRDAKRNSTAENAWAGSVPFAEQLVMAGRHGKREAKLGIVSSGRRAKGRRGGVEEGSDAG